MPSENKQTLQVVMGVDTTINLSDLVILNKRERKRGVFYTLRNVKVQVSWRCVNTSIILLVVGHLEQLEVNPDMVSVQRLVVSNSKNRHQETHTHMTHI